MLYAKSLACIKYLHVMGVNMEIAVVTFRLHAPWVHSLKEKRMIVKSIIAKVQNQFHVSVSEIDEQDIHQIKQ